MDIIGAIRWDERSVGRGTVVVALVACLAATPALAGTERTDADADTEAETCLSIVERIEAEMVTGDAITPWHHGLAPLGGGGSAPNGAALPALMMEAVPGPSGAPTADFGVAAGPGGGMAPGSGGTAAETGGVALAKPGQLASTVFPPDVERDRFPEVAMNGVIRVADQPVSTFSADVDTASMGVVRRFLRDGDRPPSDAVRVEELVNYFDYDYPRPRIAAEPFAPSVHVMPSPWGAGRELMVVGIKGWSPARSRRPDANIVLLADVSGSMQGPDRLGLVKRSMALLVDQLEGRDVVSLVTYAGADQVVLPPTAADDKQTICSALGHLSSGGRTAGSKGIATAYDLAEDTFRAGGINRVILATDGDFNLGVIDDGRLEDYVADKRDSGIYLSILGVGRGNYNDRTMQSLAQAGNGMAAYLDSLEEGRRVLVEKLTAQLQPIADDVKLQVEFNPARVAEYRLVGYETRLLREEDFANDAVDAGEIGDGHTVTALYEIAAPGSAGLRLPEHRYASPDTVAPAGGRDAEIAVLRIRWKAPGETASRLMERPVTEADRAPLARQDDDTRFAVAVAGLAQILRRESALGDYGFGDVIALAQGSLGDDPHGHRRAFLDLVRRAIAIE